MACDLASNLILTWLRILYLTDSQKHEHQFMHLAISYCEDSVVLLFAAESEDAICNERIKQYAVQCWADSLKQEHTGSGLGLCAGHRSVE